MAKLSMRTGIVLQEGDREQCDRCTLSPLCKLYEPGGDCRVEAEPTPRQISNMAPASRLADFTKTRDPEVLLDGLGELLQLQIEAALKASKESPSVDLDDDLKPKDRLSAIAKHQQRVDKLLNAAFHNGVTYAKMRAPALRQAKVSIEVQAAEAGITQSQLAQAIREISEQTDIPRDQVTHAMALNWVQQGSLGKTREQMAEATRVAIEGAVDAETIEPDADGNIF